MNGEETIFLIAFVGMLATFGYKMWCLIDYETQKVKNKQPSKGEIFGTFFIISVCYFVVFQIAIINHTELYIMSLFNFAKGFFLISVLFLFIEILIYMVAGLPTNNRMRSAPSVFQNK